MNSTDAFIATATLPKYQELLDANLNPADWTKENRAEKIENALNIIDNISDESVEFTIDLLQKKIGSKPLLKWKLKTQFLEGIIKFLMDMRDELDVYAENDMDSLPVDYEWLTNQIRELKQTCVTIDRDIDAVVQDTIKTLTSPEAHEL